MNADNEEISKRVEALEAAVEQLTRAVRESVNAQVACAVAAERAANFSEEALKVAAGVATALMELRHDLGGRIDEARRDMEVLVQIAEEARIEWQKASDVADAALETLRSRFRVAGIEFPSEAPTSKLPPPT